MLTYRTNISGTPVSQRLPFRVLVLGDFSGGTSKINVRPPLEQRQIRSFDRTKGNVRVDDFMLAMNPWVELPEAHRETFQGTLTFGELEVDFKTSSPKADQEYQVRGVASFESTREQTGTAKIEAEDLTVSGKLKLKLGDGPEWEKCTAVLTISGIVADATPTPGGAIGRPVAVLKDVVVNLAAGEILKEAERLGGSNPGAAQKYLIQVGPPKVVSATRVLAFNSLLGFSPDAIAKVSATGAVQTTEYINHILHAPEVRTLESNWRGLADLVDDVSNDDVIIDFLDITRAELDADVKDNAADPFGSALFHKLYVEEYDRCGGRPFASMIGLYEFSHDEESINTLKVLQRICAAAHCPFISSVNARFFNLDSMAGVAAVTDLDAIMNHPRMAPWNELRDTEWSAYIGLTLPRYLLRRPWDHNDPGQSDFDRRNNQVQFVEEVHPEETGDDTNFLWGNAAILFAKNMVRSYESSGWAQHIRGPRGGGAVDGLRSYTHTRVDGSEVTINPVEIAVPDYREYQFSKNGLIPLVQCKGEVRATFFSAQSIRRPKDFQEELNTRNAYLVTNLAYTFSITIIAHYVKVMMREYIGSIADATYIQHELSTWLSQFVTTVVNPDDLTLFHYPLKATRVTVEPKPGPFGWYAAIISVLPHAQFEGMDVELQLEAALGGKA
jgi:type VI secretion system protein ImpC